MSDMRNFGSSNEPMTMSEKIPETNLGVPTQFHDSVGLSNVHHPVEEETNSNTARMVGAAVVAVMLCGAGAYAYMSSSSMSKSPVAASSQPTSAPQSVAANTPSTPAMQTAPATPPSDNSALANSPYGSPPVGKSSPTPAATPASAPEDKTIVKHPVRTARAVEKKEAVEDKQEAQTTNQLNTQESASVTPAAPANAANATTPSANDNVASSTPLPTPPDGALRNVLALDGTPLAWTRSHGQAITWFGSRLSSARQSPAL